MRKALGTAMAASILMTNPAAARDWPDTAGWSIAESTESCGMILDYEGSGSTRLIVLLHLNGGVGLQLTNDNWSAKKDEAYPMRWVLNGYQFTGNSTGVEGSSGQRGFLGRFGADVLPELRRGDSLRVYLGDKLVDQLTLNGSAAALAVTQRCLEYIRAEKAAADRETARLAHIPEDPFASPRKPETTNLSFGADSYPPSALRDRQQGDVKVRLDIDAAGRVSACAIEASSGSSALDDATCRIMRFRQRFDLGLAQQQVTRTVEWRLPN